MHSYIHASVRYEDFAIHTILNNAFYKLLAAVSQLKPVTLELHKNENRELHKTDDYEQQQLIVRRGQAFDVTVTFNRDYNQEDDILVVQFVTGVMYSLFELFLCRRNRLMINDINVLSIGNS